MVWSDLSEIGRALRRSPRFTIGFSLVLGVGLAGVIFVISLLQATVFRKIPWTAPEQLYALMFRDNEVPRQWTVRDATVARLGVASGLAITWYLTTETSVAAAGDSSTVRMAVVEPLFFETLGLSGREGGLPSAQDADGDDVLVLSSRMRERLFPGDPAVGQLVNVGGSRLAVRGVLPSGSEYPIDVDVWQVQRARLVGADERAVDVIVRDSAGRSAEAVQALLAGVTAATRPAKVEPGVRTTIRATSLVEQYRPRIGRRVRVIVTGIVAVIVLVVVNLSNAMLLRAERNLFGSALRVTLGAPTSRLVRHAVLEVLILVVTSLVLGLGLAAAMASTMHSALGGPLAHASIIIDGKWLFTLLLALLLVIGALAAAPLLTLRRVEPAVALRVSSTSGTPMASRMRRLFLGLQVGVTVFFLLIAATIGLAFAQVTRLDLGYGHGELSFATIGLRAEEYQDPARVRAVAEDIARRARQSLAVPAVAVWGTTYPHRLALQTESPIQIPDRVLPAQDPRILPVLSVDVNPEYFRVLGIPLRRGRAFDASDTEGSTPVVILDERAAKALWGDADAVGRTLRLGGRASTLPWMTVVGVVASSQPVHPLALEWELEGTRFPLMYRPLRQSDPTSLLAPLSDPGFSIAVASGSTPAQVARTFEQLFTEVTPGERPAFNGPLRDFVDRAGRFEEARFESVTLALFGGIGVLLALLGVATAVDEALHARTREIGIRLALGAPASAILRLVSIGALRVASAGMVAAMVLFTLSGRAMQGLLRETPTASTGSTAQVPWVFVLGVVSCTAVLVLLIAVWRARKATGVDPSLAMRAE